MRLIWATRGKAWGSRFFLEGDCEDPLPTYDMVFASIGDEREAWRRVGDTVALRFPDPLGRRDSAGRVITHEFVVFPPDADQIDSVETGRSIVWPIVATQFNELWDKPDPHIGRH